MGWYRALPWDSPPATAWVRANRGGFYSSSASRSRLQGSLGTGFPPGDGRGAPSSSTTRRLPGYFRRGRRTACSRMSSASLRKCRRVESWSRRTGDQLGFFITEPNIGDLRPPASGQALARRPRPSSPTTCAPRIEASQARASADRVPGNLVEGRHRGSHDETPSRSRSGSSTRIERWREAEGGGDRHMSRAKSTGSWTSGAASIVEWADPRPSSPVPPPRALASGPRDLATAVARRRLKGPRRGEAIRRGWCASGPCGSCLQRPPGLNAACPAFAEVPRSGGWRGRFGATRGPGDDPHEPRLKTEVARDKSPVDGDPSRRASPGGTLGSAHGRQSAHAPGPEHRSSRGNATIQYGGPLGRATVVRFVGLGRPS